MHKAVKAKKVFNRLAANQGEAKRARLVKARRVQAGDSITLTGLFTIMDTARENGWHVESVLGSQQSFYDESDFDAQFTKEDRSLNTGKQELHKDAIVETVKKGEHIEVFPWGDDAIGLMTDAEEDGWLVTQPGGKPRFFSDYTFRTTFKTDAPLLNESLAIYRETPDEDAEITPFVVLPCDTVFDFEDGEYTAPKGSTLYPNADDVDGYTVLTPEEFDGIFIVTKPATKAPATVLKFQPK